MASCLIHRHRGLAVLVRSYRKVFHQIVVVCLMRAIFVGEA